MARPFGKSSNSVAPAMEADGSVQTETDSGRHGTTRFPMTGWMTQLNGVVVFDVGGKRPGGQMNW